jgi:ABC-type transport system substrate-binding protein
MPAYAGVMRACLPLVAIILAAAGPVPAQAPAAGPEVRPRLQFSRAGDLDPAFNTRAADYFVYSNIFSHLVRWRPGGTVLEGDLAERWEASADARVWTFRLRRNVQLHKGYGELTSEDVRFTFRRFLDPDVGSPEAGDWAGVERIETPDRYTVRIVLREPNAVFAANPVAGRAAMIVSRRAVLQKGRGFSRDPIGTGPFVFERWSPAGEIALAANPAYFRGAPRIGRIAFIPIAEDAVAAAALERGEIHAMWTRGSPEVERILRANPAITVDVVPKIGSLRFLAVNPQHRPLADVRVRQAVAHALNRKELEIASEGQMIGAGHLLPDLPWLREAAAAGRFPTYRYDPARAKRLLADAGHPSLRVTLMFPLAAPSPLIAQVVAEQLRRVGIEVQLEGVEQLAWNRRWRAAEFQLTTASLTRGAEPDGLARDLLHTASFPPGGNAFRYDRADGLIDDGARERDPRRRQEIYIRLLRQVMADVPYLPLATDNVVAAWRAPIRRMTTGINNDFVAYSIERGP